MRYMPDGVSPGIARVRVEIITLSVESEVVSSGRKTSAAIARLLKIYPVTVSRIVSQVRTGVRFGEHSAMPPRCRRLGTALAGPPRPCFTRPSPCDVVRLAGVVLLEITAYTVAKR
jgi:hypothetical protein